MEWLEWAMRIGMGLVMLLGVGAVALILTRRATPRVSAPPGWAQGQAAGRWFAAVKPYGDTFSAPTYGVLELAAGRLIFVAENETSPRWVVPLPSLTVATAPLISAGGARLDSAITGPLSLDVSTRRINRVLGNDIKNLQEQRTAAEVVGLLVSLGARPGA